MSATPAASSIDAWSPLCTNLVQALRSCGRIHSGRTQDSRIVRRSSTGPLGVDRGAGRELESDAEDAAEAGAPAEPFREASEAAAGAEGVPGPCFESDAGRLFFFSCWGAAAAAGEKKMR